MTLPTTPDWMACAVSSARNVCRHGPWLSFGNATVRPWPISQESVCRHPTSLVCIASVHGVEAVVTVCLITGLSESTGMSVRNIFLTVAATAAGSAVGAGAAGPAAAPDDEELLAVVLEHAASTTATAAVAASLTMVVVTPRPKRLGVPFGIEVSTEDEPMFGCTPPGPHGQDGRRACAETLWSWWVSSCCGAISRSARHVGIPRRRTAPG